MAVNLDGLLVILRFVVVDGKLVRGEAGVRHWHRHAQTCLATVNEHFKEWKNFQRKRVKSFLRIMYINIALTNMCWPQCYPGFGKAYSQTLSLIYRYVYLNLHSKQYFSAASLDRCVI